MKLFFSKSLFVTLLLMGGSLAASTPADDKTDWKYAVGWDGTVLDPTAIGEPIGPATNETSLQKRTVGGVYICEDINWGGKCGYAVQPLEQCIKLGGDWNHKISSFGPDPCTYCIGHEGSACTIGDWWTFEYPGDATGGLGGFDPWNDRISSFECFNSPSSC